MLDGHTGGTLTLEAGAARPESLAGTAERALLPTRYNINNWLLSNSLPRA